MDTSFILHCKEGPLGIHKGNPHKLGKEHEHPIHKFAMMKHYFNRYFINCINIIFVRDTCCHPIAADLHLEHTDPNSKATPT